ncbi:translocation protein TolB [Lysinibacillus sp. SGAir0095]|uniref:translocation protein TolB n=1 Tax=Lysinibacillus sp. SGAir0095 TaxID=2070463 RepID=UPI0010CD6AB3|nr:translocation protein TolB [Lysinibacillus sp. SGAir0095]QCR30711.1 translocation protein TolB [Lysinibacillus sp. SGAir0095]
MSRILLVILFLIGFSLDVSAETPFKATFIRDHQLWIKEGEKEIQLTEGLFVSSPQWSIDGRFIAYLAGNKAGEKQYLTIYDSKVNKSYQPYQGIETHHFKWSPTSNQLAYTVDGILRVTKMKNGRPQGFENVALGVSNFEWFPDGDAFIVSSQSDLVPTGWGPVPLFKVPLDTHLDTNKITPFFTIQTNEEDLFAIDTAYFKWSADGKWLSLLAIPTASWSNDSNTLCVISSTGDNFQVIGKMLGFEDWIKWAPSKNQLAFISGEGRFFVENKNTAIADIPISTTPKAYTPKGYVDLDLEWLSPDKIIVARSKDHKDWNEGPVPIMYTSLYTIDLKSGEQKQLTFPKNNELDSSPQVVGNAITWLRKVENQVQGDVWIKENIDDEPYVWIKNVESTPVFFNESN